MYRRLKIEDEKLDRIRKNTQSIDEKVKYIYLFKNSPPDDYCYMIQ